MAHSCPGEMARCWSVHRKLSLGKLLMAGTLCFICYICVSLYSSHGHANTVVSSDVGGDSQVTARSDVAFLARDVRTYDDVTASEDYVRETSYPEMPDLMDLPVFWQTHSKEDILKRFRQPVQNFSIDDFYNHSNSDLDIKLPPLQVDLTEMNKFRKNQTYPEYFEKVGNEDDADEMRPDIAELKLFAPLFEEHRALFLFTMDVFVRACRTYNWTYFLVGGSLLGAYRHHGMIPWDVDIDVAVSLSHWREVGVGTDLLTSQERLWTHDSFRGIIRRVLGNTPHFTLWTQVGGVWRFYLSQLPVLDNESGWPFVELYFFAEDDAHIWGHTKSLRYFMADKQHVFPLVTTRWEHLHVTIPRCTGRLLKIEFEIDECISHYEFSKERGFVVRDEEGRVDCSELHDVYPFVFRKPVPNKNYVEETTKIGQKILYQRLVLPEPSVCRVADHSSPSTVVPP